CKSPRNNHNQRNIASDRLGLYHQGRSWMSQAVPKYCSLEDAIYAPNHASFRLVSCELRDGCGILSDSGNRRSNLVAEYVERVRQPDSACVDSDDWAVE